MENEEEEREESPGSPRNPFVAVYINDESQVVARVVDYADKMYSDNLYELVNNSPEDYQVVEQQCDSVIGAIKFSHRLGLRPRLAMTAGLAERCAIEGEVYRLTASVVARKSALASSVATKTTLANTTKTLKSAKLLISIAFGVAFVPLTFVTIFEQSLVVTAVGCVATLFAVAALATMRGVCGKAYTDVKSELVRCETEVMQQATLKELAQRYLEEVASTFKVKPPTVDDLL